MTMPEAKIPLDYAPRRRRRITARVVSIAISCVLVAVMVGLAGSWLMRVAPARYWQGRAMHLTMPADAVVWELNKPSPTAANVADRVYGRIGRTWVDSTCVFLHARGPSDGEERLVSLGISDVTFNGEYPRRSGFWNCAVYVPSWQGASKLTVGGPCQFPPMFFRGQTLRIFAGQPDPVDESHFTIRFERDGVEGFIDGYLKSDDSVVLEERASATQK